MKDTVILTRFGTSYIGATSTRKNPASRRLRELLKKLGVHRSGLNHSCLRHHLQTIAEETGEAIAVQVIMGHAPAGGDVSAAYRKLVFKPAFDARLRKVTNHVWQWLYAY